MIIGSLQVRIHIPGAQSLKSKRLVLKSVITKVRNQFNVSIAELNGHDLWQSCTLGIVVTGRERKFLDQVLNKLMDHLNSVRTIEVVDYHLEFL